MPDSGVELSTEPSPEWLQLWWEVDGRGGVPGGAAPRWGGLYGMATRPDARRRGYARLIMEALLREGAARRLAGYWLLVTASNHGAQQLYACAGFSEAARYLYRQDRPKRHLTGC